MEIALVTSGTIRIKGKQVTFVVDPSVSKAKLAADAVILLTKSVEEAPVEGERVAINGSGEYEVAGVKVTGVSNAGEKAYYISIDGVSVLLASALSLKSKEHVQDTDIIIMYTNEVVDSSLLTNFNPRVVVVYGMQTAEEVSSLGKEPIKVAKYAVTKDKLPAEMEVVMLQ